MVIHLHSLSYTGHLCNKKSLVNNTNVQEFYKTYEVDATLFSSNTGLWVH